MTNSPLPTRDSRTNAFTRRKRHLITRRACFWTSLLAMAMIAFECQPARAAVTEAWVYRFSNVVSNLTDEAVKVVRDAAGDIIVTGTTSGGLPGAADILTIKYSVADGAVLWRQRYNSPENGEDRSSALAVDGSGNVIVTGASASGSDAIYTAKYATADGGLLWEKRFTGPASVPLPTSVADSPHCLALGPNGMVAVTGSSLGRD